MSQELKTKCESGSCLLCAYCGQVLPNTKAPQRQIENNYEDEDDDEDDDDDTDYYNDNGYDDEDGDDDLDPYEKEDDDDYSVEVSFKL